MTELDIIRDLEYCISMEAESEAGKKREQLLKDAVTVIKAQKSSIEELVKTLSEQQAQIDGLNGLLANRYDERLVAVLNEIIGTVSCEDGYLDDTIDAIQTAMYELQLDGHIKIGKNDKIPKIVLCK